MVYQNCKFTNFEEATRINAIQISQNILKNQAKNIFLRKENKIKNYLHIHLILLIYLFEILVYFFL